MTVSWFRALPTAKYFALPFIALGACLAVPAHAQSDNSTYDRSDEVGPRYNGAYIAVGVGAILALRFRFLPGSASTLSESTSP